MISYILRVVCSAQRLTLNAARLARPILGTVWRSGGLRGELIDACGCFSGARALWKEASLC